MSSGLEGKSRRGTEATVVALTVFGTLSGVELVSNLVAGVVPAWGARFSPVVRELLEAPGISCEVDTTTLHPSEVLALLSMLVTVVTVFLGAIWVADVGRRLQAVRRPHEPQSRASTDRMIAILAFLFPLINLIFPYFMLKELWQLSTPESEPPSSGLGWVKLWAMAWAGMWVVSPSRGDVDTATFQTQAFTAACSLCVAVLSVKLIRGLEARQPKRSAGSTLTPFRRSSSPGRGTSTASAVPYGSGTAASASS